MFGTRLGFAVGLLLATLAGITGATAADYVPPPPPPPPVIVQPPPREECCNNWYLRGFVGVGMNNKYTLESSPTLTDGYFASDSIGDSMLIGGGVGYNWNSWLRFDATVEYRAKARITALATEQPGGAGPVAVDQYEGNLKSWVFLANAYVDLGTWDCFTPFVGAGIGGAYNMISDFSDVTPSVAAFGATGSSFGLGRNTGHWDFAWALYGGMSYAVSRNFNIDLTYRYLDYGSAKETVDCNGGSGCYDFNFKNLTSNDIMLSLRWTCCELTAVAPPPPRYYAPPPPAYQPPTYQPPTYQSQIYQAPPVYQPPLRAKD